MDEKQISNVIRATSRHPRSPEVDFHDAVVKMN